MDWNKQEAEKWDRVKSALGYALASADKEIVDAIFYWNNYELTEEEEIEDEKDKE